MWRWDSWAFDPNSMAVVDERGVVAPYNTVIFAVSGSGEGKARSAIRSDGRVALEASGGV
jgi:hypothetical protein